MDKVVTSNSAASLVTFEKIILCSVLKAAAFMPHEIVPLMGPR